MTCQPLRLSLGLFALALLAAGAVSLRATASDNGSPGHCAGAEPVSAPADEEASACGFEAVSICGNDNSFQVNAADGKRIAAELATRDCCDKKAECDKKADCDKKTDCKAKAACETVAISAEGEKKAQKEKAEKDKAERQIATPKVIAVMFHSDRCASCKALDPRIQEAAEQLTDKPVLFVTLDLTSDKTRKQAELLAGALGLDDLWKANHTRTGFMKLADAETGMDMATITVRHETDVIIDAIVTSLDRIEFDTEAEAAADAVELRSAR